MAKSPSRSKKPPFKTEKATPKRRAAPSASPSHASKAGVGKRLAEVMVWLEQNADPRGISHWNKRDSQLTSFGIGLTRLRQYAKQLGRDHELAQALWQSEVYEAKVLGLLVDDPKQITREQAQQQVAGGLGAGLLVHVFTSCGAPLAKTPFAFELSRQWMDDPEPVRRQCGYALLYELSKKNPPGMDDAFLLQRIERIQAAIHQEPMWVREAMNSALLGIGKRNKKLNAAAIRAAKAIGPVEIDYGEDNNCQPLDVAKHLTSELVQQKISRNA